MQDVVRVGQIYKRLCHHHDHPNATVEKVNVAPGKVTTVEYSIPNPHYISGGPYKQRGVCTRTLVHFLDIYQLIPDEDV